ncbi:gp53-like domain-containing protein [Pseudomonas asiatica]|uniref:Putative tail fiber protein gp53-like C-terminal domain-containing protein n=1 Tax=Pseudomonas asiatica TaxID=2219225 RepID=A0A9X4CXD4_9PSED|nr:hypothetical protein [Pseudomonas asiatica]MDD2105721.1 hypothetical protein [Pseudomonas asiatica]
MADLPETAEWTPGIYQFETSDPVLGGPEGIDNLPSKQLANRTAWLKQRIASLESGDISVGKAGGLAQARMIAITGDASWSVSFNGEGNVTAVLTLANSGVAAGSYGKVTVNAKGLVVAGSALSAADIPDLDWSKIATGKPSNLAGYGITPADQAQAELGADNTRPMTPLRVFQAIAKVVVQATEVAFGWAKVATQAQADAGTDDTTIVTPKKLRNGFVITLGASGYIAFPTWLGGLVVQWGSATIVGIAGNGFSFPTAFPNACLKIIGTVTDPSSSDDFVTFHGAYAPAGASARNSSASTRTVAYIAIGN